MSTSRYDEMQQFQSQWREQYPDRMLDWSIVGQDRDNPPSPPRTEPYKTHLAYVKERRSDDEAEQILTEALETLRARRARGEVIY